MENAKKKLEINPRPRRVNVSFRLPEDLVLEIERVLKTKPGLSKTALLEAAIKEFLRQLD